MPITKIFVILTSNTRGPLVYAGDHNGTVVHVYAYEGGPCG
jgi:hypothetical protein